MAPWLKTLVALTKRFQVWFPAPMWWLKSTLVLGDPELGGSELYSHGTFTCRQYTDTHRFLKLS